MAKVFEEKDYISDFVDLIYNFKNHSIDDIEYDTKLKVRDYCDTLLSKKDKDFLTFIFSNSQKLNPAIWFLFINKCLIPGKCFHTDNNNIPLKEDCHHCNYNLSRPLGSNKYILKKNK